MASRDEDVDVWGTSLPTTHPLVMKKRHLRLLSSSSSASPRPLRTMTIPRLAPSRLADGGVSIRPRQSPLSRPLQVLSGGTAAVRPAHGPGSAGRPQGGRGATCWTAGALPLLGDVEHHDHAAAVLVHVQELRVQGQLGLRLGRGGDRA